MIFTLHPFKRLCGNLVINKPFNDNTEETI